MPETSLPCRMRSISRLALSSPSALRSTLLTYSSVSGTSMLLLGGQAGEALEHAVDPLARHRLHLGDGLAQALHFLRREVLEDLGRLLLAERHQQDRGVSRGLARPCSERSVVFPADPAAHDVGHRRRVLLGQLARAGQVLAARRFEQRRAAAAGQRHRVVGDDVELAARRGAAGVAARRPSAPGARSRTRRAAPPAPAPPARRRCAPGRCSQGCFHSGSVSAFGDRVGLERRVDQLDRVAALLAEADRLAAPARSASRPRRPSAACSWSCPWRGDDAVVDHHRGVQALDVAGGVARHAHRLVDLVVGDGVAPRRCRRRRRPARPAAAARRR